MGTTTPPPGKKTHTDAPRKKVPIFVHAGGLGTVVDGNEEVTARTVGGMGLFVLMIAMLVLGGLAAVFFVAMFFLPDKSGGAKWIVFLVAALPLYIGIRIWQRLRRG